MYIFNTCNMNVHFISKIVICGRGIVCTRQISTIVSKARDIEERKIKVDDVEINYARIGTGVHPVLLLPGVMGSIWTAFKPQIENLNRDKLTIVTWDPPGYGKSRPPDKTFPDDFFQLDATWAHNLMKTLGYSKFSLVGWSDGGTTSLVLAAMYPDSIRKMVVVGANAYLQQDEIKIYKHLSDINNWSEKIKASLIQIYGEDYFKKTILDIYNYKKRFYEKQNGNQCKQVLPKIKCPTLIIHGAKDAQVLPEHSTYLKQNIANSKLHIFEKGTHNLHLKYPGEFNNLVTDFLVNQSKM